MDMELQRRMEAISAMEPEVMTAAEAESLKAAEAMDDGSTVTLEEMRQIF